MLIVVVGKTWDVKGIFCKAIKLSIVGITGIVCPWMVPQIFRIWLPFTSFLLLEKVWLCKGVCLTEQDVKKLSVKFHIISTHLVSKQHNFQNIRHLLMASTPLADVMPSYNCDQIVRYFLNIWSFIKMKSYLLAWKIAKVCSKLCQINRRNDKDF